MSSSSGSATAAERSVLEDVRLYVTAPVRWEQRDWLYAGSAVLAIAASHQVDERVRQHFANDATYNSKDTYSTKDSLPAVAILAGTWALAWGLDDSAGYQEGRDMLEAGAFSAVTASALKLVVHRERPAASASSTERGGDSFPSRHVSVAMAIGVVLAESGGDDYRWVRRGLGYGVGLTTVYARLKHQQHWLSDTVAGAALGIATARFVLNRSHPEAASSAFMVMPVNDGIMLSYAAAFR